jgi:DNA-binding Lrp family transcriptional regulator
VQKKAGAVMTLTKRRQQFLGSLMDLYQKTNLPIHYETLANSIGVSKWTAYDMLKALEKLGYISRSYEVNNKETGRSQVVFIPTSKASNLFVHPRNEVLDPVNWSKTVDYILWLLKDLKNISLSEALKRLMDEVSKVNNRMNFCAYILGLLLVYVKKLGGKTESLIYHMIERTPNQDMRLTMFVGTVLGTIFQTKNVDLGTEFSELISQMLTTIAELSNNEKEMLSVFLGEALLE